MQPQGKGHGKGGKSMQQDPRVTRVIDPKFQQQPMQQDRHPRVAPPQQVRPPPRPNGLQRQQSYSSLLHKEPTDHMPGHDQAMGRNPRRSAIDYSSAHQEPFADFPTESAAGHQDRSPSREPGQRGASKLGGKMKKVWRSMTFQKPKSDQKSKSVRNFNDRDVPYDPRLLQRAATAEELANRNPMMHEQQSTLVAA
jgi:hypothetical protein